jgi:hypothetical protein
VRIGSEDAEVLDARPDRIVARVPALGTYGRVDLQVRTAVGFRTQEDAFRYDGPGSRPDSGSPISTPGGPRVRRRSSRQSWGFSDLVATGAAAGAPVWRRTSASTASGLVPRRRPPGSTAVPPRA